jgi:hypothetical protein
VNGPEHRIRELGLQKKAVLGNPDSKVDIMRDLGFPEVRASGTRISFFSFFFLRIYLFQVFHFPPLLLCWVGGHCGIYKVSYNVSTISYLNSPLSPVPFILPFLNSWNSFSRYHFCIYMHVYTYFAPYSSS